MHSDANHMGRQEGAGQATGRKWPAGGYTKDRKSLAPLVRVPKSKPKESPGWEICRCLGLKTQMPDVTTRAFQPRSLQARGQPGGSPCKIVQGENTEVRAENVLSG